MPHWSLDDIAWEKFDAGAATPPLISLIKAACMVEHNAQDYAAYLCEVFADDPDFQQAAKDWAEEEVQHGRALRRWAEMADPTFDFDKSFKTFTDGYKLPTGVSASVRGSRAGELVARCVVEIGTSSYYTAIKESTPEPVLRDISAKIAADEFRHYKLFYTHLQRYLEKEHLSSLARLKIAIGRVAESEDDELAYAFYAAHHPGGERSYDRKEYANRYLACAGAFYRKQHIHKMVAMAFKAVGLSPHTLLGKTASAGAWAAMRCRLALAQFHSQPA